MNELHMERLLTL